MVGYIQDLTDRIETENELKYLLNEKESLLAEVHDRVKNNLQIILSLLTLNIRVNPDKPEKTIESTQNRIISMSLIHEQIYQSPDHAHINLKNYIIEEYQEIFKQNKNIKLDYNMENILIDMDTAIPLGLILTEVISNTVQHAYPNNETKGNFTLESMEDNGNIIIVMRNDGDDLPADFDLDKSNTLGVTIIKSLTQELEGTFEMVSDNGTKVIITFPIK